MHTIVPEGYNHSPEDQLVSEQARLEYRYDILLEADHPQQTREEFVSQNAQRRAQHKEYNHD